MLKSPCKIRHATAESSADLLDREKARHYTVHRLAEIQEHAKTLDNPQDHGENK